MQALPHMHSLQQLPSPDSIRQQEGRSVRQQCSESRDSQRLHRATRDHLVRLDNLIASSMAITATTVDCQKGCDYCCYYKVALTAGELFLIGQHLLKHFSEQRLQQVLAAARDNTETTRDMTTAQQLASNIKCPLLLDGACSTYEVRPAMCRKHHSTDVTLCRQSFDHPENAAIPNPEQPQVSRYVLAAITGARDGMAQAGLDAQLYDLSRGLVELFSDSKAEKRWKKGKRAFLQ